MKKKAVKITPETLKNLVYEAYQAGFDRCYDIHTDAYAAFGRDMVNRTYKDALSRSYEDDINDVLETYDVDLRV